MPTGRRVSVIGGGPGGLFVARLLKRNHPTWRVEVYDRNPEDSVYGFGVGLGGQALTAINGADPDVHDDLVRLGASRESTQRLTNDLGTSSWSWGGWKSLSISRAKLLTSLRHRAEEAGVIVTLESAVTYHDVADADLVIAADGANSVTRTQLANEFVPSLRPGRCKTIWLGAHADPPIDTSLFVVRSNDHGLWALHAYPYGGGMATLVIETDESTWMRSGLGDASTAAQTERRADLVSRNYLADLFSDYLNGAELQMSNSHWFTFTMVRNQSWTTRNVALLGDAAHTAHPSIGSGTRMAMEDGIALADAFATERSIVDALTDYQSTRKPQVERLQAAALPSQRWWETIEDRASLAPAQLGMHYISRTGLYPLRRFRRRDPDFAEQVLHDFTRTFPDGAAPDPLGTPLRLGKAEVANRWVERQSCSDAARRPHHTGLHIVIFPRGGIIPSELGAIGGEGAPAGISVDLEDAARALQAAASHGTAFIELRLPALSLTGPALNRVQEHALAWSHFGPPDNLGLGLGLSDVPTSPDHPAFTEILAFCEGFKNLGISLVCLSPCADSREEPAPMALLEIADRIKARSNVPVLLDSHVDPDAAETAIVCGRIDLVTATSAD